jgi:very-short-patch-repair endonuclease
MPAPDVRVAALARSQWGVASLADLLACGISRDAVTTRVATGRLHRLHRGVYAVGHTHLGFEARLLAASMACGPTAAVSHFSAAALLGFVEPDGRYPEVTVVGTTARVHRGIRVHRTRSLAPEDLVRHGPLTLTSPARTIVDLAGALDPAALRRITRQAQSLRRTSTREILAALDRLRPRRGSRTLARLLTNGPAPTRSALEDVVLDLILSGGLQVPEINTPLVIAGRRVIPDFRWPEQHLVVEADGAAWHDGAIHREDDAERQALLEAHGERVLRITWSQAVAARAQTLARLRAAGAPPRPRGS